MNLEISMQYSVHYYLFSSRFPLPELFVYNFTRGCIVGFFLSWFHERVFFSHLDIYSYQELNIDKGFPT